MYYIPSGKITPLSSALGIITAIVTAPIIGFVYTYAVWYIPFIYVNFLVTLFSGFGVHYVLNKSFHYLKSRNKTYNVLVALMAGVFVSYVNWAVWVDLVMNTSDSYNLGDRIGISVSSSSLENVLNLLLNPQQLLEYAKLINELGTWGIRSVTVTGWFLGIIWIIEAVMLIGVPTVLAFANDIEPFDEDSNEWSEKKEIKYEFEYSKEPAQLKSELEQRKFDTLVQIGPKLSESLHYLQMTVYLNPRGKTAYLTVINKEGQYDKDNKLEYTDTEIVKFLEITKELAQTLLQKSI